MRLEPGALKAAPIGLELWLTAQLLDRQWFGVFVIFFTKGPMGVLGFEGTGTTFATSGAFLSCTFLLPCDVEWDSLQSGWLVKKLVIPLGADGLVDWLAVNDKFGFLWLDSVGVGLFEAGRDWLGGIEWLTGLEWKLESTEEVDLKGGVNPLLVSEEDDCLRKVKDFLKFEKYIHVLQLLAYKDSVLSFRWRRWCRGC